ncbi:Hypothetical protein POVN_LOCUS101 [uncultured virus]|nr:Hypothetical protein POVN_LOCUS101 [uncultured virus]
MALWSDEKTVNLSATTSPEYLFLAVRPDAPKTAAEQLAAFLPLVEGKWHPEAKGWLLPVTVLPTINPFLEKFHELCAPLERSEWHRVLELGYGMKGQVSVYTLTYSEFRGLVLLTNCFGKEVTDTFYKEPTLPQFSEDQSFYSAMSQLDLLNPRSVPSTEKFDPERKGLQRYLDATFRLCQNKGFTVRRGDVLRHTFRNYSNNGVFICDGTTFIPLEQPERNGIVPAQFKVPLEFPLNYWTSCIEGRLVWPDFDKLASRMEYTETPPKLDKSYTETGSHRWYGIHEYSALQFDCKGVGDEKEERYYIYFHFEGGYGKPTYERIMEWLATNSPASLCWNAERSMICQLESRPVKTPDPYPIRAPSLHRQSLLAGPVVYGDTDSMAVRYAAFTVDFDGDEMNLHAPRFETEHGLDGPCGICGLGQTQCAGHPPSFLALRGEDRIESPPPSLPLPQD